MARHPPTYAIHIGGTHQAQAEREVFCLMIQVTSTWLKCWQRPKDLWVKTVSTNLPSLPMSSNITIDLFQH